MILPDTLGMPPAAWEWLEDGRAFVLPAKHARGFHEYLGTLPWLASSPDWSRVPHREIRIGSSVDHTHAPPDVVDAEVSPTELAAWLATTQIGTHSQIALCYSVEGGIVISIENLTVENLDELFQQCPGPQFAFGCDSIDGELVPRFEDFLEYGLTFLRASSSAVQELLASEVTVVQDWLARAEADPATVPEDFNWLGLAFCAGSNAHAASDVAEADAWALVSIRAYQRLFNTRPDASFELSQMNLRAALICRYGMAENSAVRNQRTLLDWFHARAAMPLADVERAARELRTIPFEQWPEHLDRIRALRALKNRINVLRLLPEPPDEIHAWISLWPLLP